MADELTIVYSGGQQNTKADNSLGGYPSPISILENKNNLFDDVSSKETTQGKTEYRCFYVFNDNDYFKIDTSIYIEYIKEDGVSVYVGLLQQNAVQSLEFTSLPTSGTFTLTVQGLKSDVITWSSNTTTLASNIQTALQAVTDCSVSYSSGKYNITFEGVLQNKALTIMSITDNNLSPAVTPTIAHVTFGSPINTIAPDTGNENTAPTGVTFMSMLTSTLIGTLYPSEGFPIWIQRVVAAGFDSVEGDGFIFHVKRDGTLLD